MKDMPFKDYEEKKRYQRNWYKGHAKSTVEEVRKRKLKIRQWFDEYKKKLKCIKCSENHPSTIDFHHRDTNEKKGEIAYLVAMGYSIERIKEELKKCDILCANCHRKFHYKNNKL